MGVPQTMWRSACTVSICFTCSINLIGYIMIISDSVIHTYVYYFPEHTYDTNVIRDVTIGTGSLFILPLCYMNQKDTFSRANVFTDSRGCSRGKMKIGRVA